MANLEEATSALLTIGYEYVNELIRDYQTGRSLATGRSYHELADSAMQVCANARKALLDAGREVPADPYNNFGPMN